ncbi:malto-oligosyltrehalose synthase [Sulfitobacter aestuarii]|uniref:Malto-oligosyltrehalose synthase n=1 Tax=Sulfitobacter aestuarii TaxID=2161676 RepID=A0ABW5TXK7_9RHOB
MKLPTATYRLQFRNGMDFDRAAALAPYLAELGVSHLYASPLFCANEGSTHGYDITDPTRIDPALGGRAGLERLSRALKAEGLGLILDIVPNHMAFSPQTPWLRDLLRHGSESRFIRHFDLLESQGRLRLPWLSAPFHELAEAGRFSVQEDDDGPVLVSDALRIPLASTATLGAARTDPAAIPKLHDEQPWQAIHWRSEMDAISHRRFFNITGLIGLRVEDEAVFEDVHALLFDLVAADIVDGVRIDHIDGLADPAGYLARLRQRLPDLPLWVEKILTGPESLPDWPVEGTTGYEITRSLNRLLVHEKGLTEIGACYRRLTGRTDDFETVLKAAKRQILSQDLAAELWQLQELFAAALAALPQGREIGPEAGRQAILAFVAAFPRYRTYMGARTISPQDRALIEDTLARADAGLLGAAALSALGAAILASGSAAARLRQRLQQVTGAVAAKAQEDTAFYREVRLLAMNEVAGEPDDGALSVDEFHAMMAQRRAQMPHGLTLTSSHDTKRSEDARARLLAASRDAKGLCAFAEACAGMAPPDLDANTIWYLVQSRLAFGEEAPEAATRLADHAVKALREAKSGSFHTAPNTALEAQAQEFARHLAGLRLADHPHPQDLDEITRRISLIQTALKLTIPGIPDIYQGSETAFFALTDPDNRGAVDFDLLSDALAGKSPLPPGLAREKLALTHALLRLRRDNPGLFLEGSYERTEAASGVLAFARRHAGQVLHCVVTLDHAVDTDTPPAPAKARQIWPIPPAKGGPAAIFLSGDGA